MRIARTPNESDLPFNAVLIFAGALSQEAHNFINEVIGLQYVQDLRSLDQDAYSDLVSALYSSDETVSWENATMLCVSFSNAERAEEQLLHLQLSELRFLRGYRYDFKEIVKQFAAIGDLAAVTAELRQSVQRSHHKSLPIAKSLLKSVDSDALDEVCTIYDTMIAAIVVKNEYISKCFCDLLNAQRMK